MSSIIPGRTLTAGILQAAIDDAATRAVAAIAPPPPATVAGAAVPRRLIATQQLNGNNSSWSADSHSDDQTFHEIRTVIGRPGWYRLRFFRDKATGTCTVAGALIAATASAASPINPVDEAGAAATWFPVTFNSAGVPVSLLDQLTTALTTSVTPVLTRQLNAPPLNAASYAGEDVADWRKQNGITYSDWIHVPPFRRTDGGSHGLIMIRVKFTGDVRPAYAVGVGYDDVAAGRFVKSYVNAGDCVTTPGAFTSTTRQTLALGLALEYIPETPVIQVALTGDSTQAPVLSHVAHACIQLSTASLPIEWCTTAKGGLSAPEYADTFRAIQNTVNPSIMFLEMWSPNAGKTLSTTELGWAKNMQIAADVMAAGGVPVLMTPPPCPGRLSNASEEAVRLLIRDRCLRARDAGMRVMDLDGLMSAGGSPVATIKPEYSTDGIHPTPEGQVLIAANATVPMLRSILNI